MGEQDSGAWRHIPNVGGREEVEFINLNKMNVNGREKWEMERSFESEGQYSDINGNSESLP